MPPPKPNANVIVRENRGQPFYEAKFRHQGRQVKRRIGPAWIERDPATGVWTRRRGRVPDGAYDERGAVVAAAEIVAAYVAQAADAERVEQERRSRAVTFREVAHDYMRWLADVAGAKPSTLRDRESVLGEPGVPRKRGEGELRAHVMSVLGDRPASKITTREVNDVLAAVSATGASASTVNKYRAVISAVFNHGCKPATFALPGNPVNGADSAASRAPARSCSTLPPRSRQSRVPSPTGGDAVGCQREIGARISGTVERPAAHRRPWRAVREPVSLHPASTLA